MRLVDIAAERGLLAGLFQYGQKALLDTSDINCTDIYTDTLNQVVYKCLDHALTTLETVDYPSLLSSANELGLYNVIITDESTKYIRSLQNHSIQQENIRPLAKKLFKLKLARDLRSKHMEAYETLSTVTGAETFDDILSKSENPILEFSLDFNAESDNIPKLIWDGAREYLEYKADNPTQIIGVPTPFAKFNKLVGGGMRRGGVTLIGARIKSGKTTFGKETALHVANNLEIPVLFLDTEMVEEEQIDRSMASLAKITIDRVETGKFGQSQIEREKLFVALRNVENKPFYYQKVAGKEFEEVLSIIRRWILTVVKHDENGKTNDCLIIYDYFKLMSTDSIKALEEYQAIGFQMSYLTDFCKKYDFPCLAFVQLNREGTIAQSDRLLWFCQSFSVLQGKTPEEEAQDGRENGNTKLMPKHCRFGPAMSDDDWINILFDKEMSIMTEGKTRFELRAESASDSEDSDE